MFRQFLRARRGIMVPIGQAFPLERTPLNMIRTNHQIVYETRGDALVIRLFGEIDHHSAVDVRTHIDEKLLSERPARVCLDLSAIDFMDSSGLGLMMGRFSLVRRYGGNFVVLDPSPAALKMISLAGMERLITIKYTNQERNRNHEQNHR